jgi:hypothetical protein
MSYLWPRPKPKPPKPQTFTAFLTVCDADRNLIPGLRAILEIETDPGMLYAGRQETERVAFGDLPLSRQGHGAYVRLKADGFRDVETRLAVLPDLGEIVMQPVAMFAPPQALVVDGKFFRKADGTRHFLKDATSFMSFKLFVEGRYTELDAHLTQLAELGFNCHRVLLSCRNMFDLNLSKTEIVAQLPRYVEYAAQFGLNANIVAFADTAPGYLDWSQEELESRWLAYGAALQSVGHLGPLLSLVNEVDATPNIIPDVTRFGKIPHILCSRGSRGSRGAPVRPWMDWEEYHNNNETQHWREPHNAMEFVSGPDGGPFSYAPMHMSETRRPDKDPVVSHHRDSAECARLLIAGFCYHCKALRYSEVLTELELDCAVAVVDGMSQIPLDCQPGPYKHRIDLERPDAGETGERAYQRGDNDACISHSLK